jgi:beta-glucosidase
MHIKKTVFVVLMLTLAIFTFAFRDGARPFNQSWIDFNKNGKMDIYEDKKQSTEKRVADLLSRMTMEEKTCQLTTLYGYGAFLKDRQPTASWKDSVWKDGIANIDEQLTGLRKDTVLAFPYSTHAEAINKIQRWFIEETRLGIPVDFTTEGIRGLNHMKATYFPAQLAQGSSFNKQLVREIGRVTGREAKALGYTNVYSPILDVSSDPRWGRMEETYGCDPFLVSMLGKENILGIQENGIISTVKHFAVYSIPVGGRDGGVRTDPHVAPREMWNLYLEPFRVAFQEAHAKGVMASYNDYDGQPIIASHYFLTDILRKQFGFNGYVTSDSHALEDLFAKHHVAKDTADAARMALNAGLNVRTEFKNPADYLKGLRRGIRNGSIAMSVVNQRVAEVLRVKFQIGLFDKPYVEDISAADRTVHNKEAKALALQAAREGIVLLENHDRILPLDSTKIGSVAIIGPNAKEHHSLLSRYGPTHASVITVFDGLKAALPTGTKINYAKGCEHIDAHFPESDVQDFDLTAKENEAIEEAVDAAKKSETVFLVLGDNENTIGETKSRLNLKLPGRQELLLKRIAALKKPMVLLLVGGRPVTFGFNHKVIPAIVETWYLGEYTGKAIADVIFGRYNPGGKLSVPFPKTVGQIPLSFPMKPSADAESKDDANVSGFLYPFGYGLSYTDFQYSDLKIVNAYPQEKKIKISFKIKNTGSRSGDEVPQLYFQDEVSSIITYSKNLRGFERVHLDAGESKIIQFVLSERDLSLLDANMKRVVEPGWFNIIIGSSSEDNRLSSRIKI